MSKKKNKFKKNKKQQVVSAPIEPVELAQEAIIEPVITGGVANIQPVIERETETDHYATDKYDHVKKDIKKILIIMSLVILALIGTYFLSLKTTVLSSFGDWVYKILNIAAE